jgi:nucleoside-diphosphate-sugar epimerase
MFMTRVVTALARGGAFELYGDGSQSRSFTFVDDAVAATIAAMERGTSAIYNVGGGDEASVRDAIALLERIAGRPLDVRFGERAPGDLARTRADSSRIGAEVGWSPRTSLEDGLRAHWEWALARVAA